MIALYLVARFKKVANLKLTLPKEVLYCHPSVIFVL